LSAEEMFVFIKKGDRRSSRRRQSAYAVFSTATQEVVLTLSFEIEELDDLATGGERSAFSFSSARATKRFPSPNTPGRLSPRLPNTKKLSQRR